MNAHREMNLDLRKPWSAKVVDEVIIVELSATLLGGVHKPHIWM